MPWNTRQTMSHSADCASPAAADARTKITSATCTSTFLLNRSASLPHSGVVAVIDSSEAVTTQV